jgi:peptidoglycan/xylan/chitin deacetylase (PgdA/CDA1 family)
VKTFLSDRRYLTLGYHKVVSPERMLSEDLELAIDRERFRRQISFLRKTGYRFVTLSDLAVLKKSKAPGKYAAITFDDGSRDIFNHALPVLRDFHAPATVFVITDFVGQDRFFPWDLEFQRQGKINLSKEDTSMSWDELSLLVRDGWEIGSHTQSHPFLTEIPLSQAEKEISESKRILEDTLGIRVTSFCYPAGYANLQLALLTEACGYECAVISFTSLRRPNGDISPEHGEYTINRISIYRGDGMLKYFAKTIGLWEVLQSSALWTGVGVKILAQLRSVSQWISTNKITRITRKTYEA